MRFRDLTLDELWRYATGRYRHGRLPGWEDEDENPSSDRRLRLDVRKLITKLVERDLRKRWRGLDF
jgi:hypothetical protein